MFMLSFFAMTVFRIRANVLISSNFQDRLNLCYRNYWRNATENEVTEEEQTNCSCEDADFNPSWAVVAPGRRQEVASQGSCNNYKTLEPHPYVNYDRDKEGPPNATADFTRPEYLRTNDIAKHHAEIGPPIDTKHTIVEGKLLIDIARIPGNE